MICVAFVQVFLCHAYSICSGVRKNSVTFQSDVYYSDRGSSVDRFLEIAWSGTYRHYFNSAIRTKKQNKALLTNDISSGGSDITFYSERI